MGACFSVEMELHFSDEKATKKMMRDFIMERNGDSVAFDIMGKNLDDLDTLVKVFLTNHNYCRVGNVFKADFNASYGWEIVLMDMFRTIAPTLQDGSRIYIEPDNDYDLLIIENGKVVIRH